ncbi:rho-related GTP-binding protein RhoE-like protein [Camelus ferus]|nr:rho-related GTP-binding protein RhoE-like protein [Camelus ferus]
MKERRASQKLSSKSIMDPNQNVKCKIVVVGDSQCGKTALLHVFAKDCFPENYVPTVFENYTASFEIDTQRIELSLWDTSGSPYYDNVRPLSYPDSDAVLICFDISRPETLDSVLKKASAGEVTFDLNSGIEINAIAVLWKGEIQEFCPNTKMLLVGCKSDLRTDVSTLVELSNHRQTPVSYDQQASKPLPGDPLLRLMSELPGGKYGQTDRSSDLYRMLSFTVRK